MIARAGTPPGECSLAVQGTFTPARELVAALETALERIVVDNLQAEQYLPPLPAQHERDKKRAVTGLPHQVSCSDPDVPRTPADRSWQPLLATLAHHAPPLPHARW